ncbi:Bifunctional protein RIB2 [Tolypocladium paradoxum]|uniref:Bifunctional protein RIB2 n=1 Tax=Tolypocladium paradoxum TaxID=94208 RepID=A0A2S4KYA9_9HYPO|nr:Bifunctional protein RIB2 [Tolypocladium paradoxum]
MGPRTADDHRTAMQQALDLANKSPPKPSNFRVGAILVKLDGDDYPTSAGGYTLECPGNTHAEECCFLKLAEQHSTTEAGLAAVVKSPHALYTTMEPCFMRLSGKLPCVERVLRQKSWIRHVYVGVQEPETFVGKNPGRQMLEEGGIEVHHVPGLEEEILRVATAGHASGCGS